MPFDRLRTNAFDLRHLPMNLKLVAVLLPSPASGITSDPSTTLRTGLAAVFWLPSRMASRFIRGLR